jgi:hypothetical protein
MMGIEAHYESTQLITSNRIIALWACDASSFNDSIMQAAAVTKRPVKELLKAISVGARS